MSNEDRITIELAPLATDEVRALIDELEQTLAAEYPPDQRHGLALDAIFQPHIRFFLARLNGAAVGCGGAALFADYAEVKRMYVRDAARGRGVAQSLLKRIVQQAREAGLGVLRLETGIRQLAALRLYEHAGFRRCAAFGAYAEMPPDAVATSVFLEQRLDAPAA
ncbi:MAG TPA: GNAT family N-acetyltransferase [Acetobacteraceae bacterium]